ncbi:SDR family oxidoreductase [Pseudonocardia thermophila]|uniref:SDR family oxidoreductase n=1 Tax=Pseudonocardia thermophila TaxID=1848 RepID=UPI00248D7FD0|nr:SDR family oxidoreductase [Pseudonocardia thermophila]
MHPGEQAGCAPRARAGPAGGHPAGRAGHPIEVAAAYVFLASDEASCTSGAVIGATRGESVFDGLDSRVRRSPPPRAR